MSYPRWTLVPVSALDRFSEATRAWFTGAFAEPTAAQEGAWTAISSRSPPSPSRYRAAAAARELQCGR